jgi:hypothetical protein
MPKNSRYTIGSRIENKILDLSELARNTYFISKESMDLKISGVSECIRVLDALKFLVALAWEAKLVGNKQFEEIAGKFDEIGRMLGGWQNGLKNPEKKNRAL